MDFSSAIIKWYEANKISFVQQTAQKKLWQYILAGILFLGVGASLPLSEMAFPQKYPLVTQDVMLNKLASSSALKQANLDPVCFQKLVVKNQLNMVRGRAIYPRYYEAGDGETFTDSVGYKAVDEGRLVFQMIGQTNGRFVFPMFEPPDFFPNASDVTLFLDASGKIWSIFVEQGDTKRMYFSETFLAPVCD